MLLAEALIHSVQVVGKERRLLAARARADLEGTAPLVVAVLGQQQRLQRERRFLQFGAAVLRLRKQQFAHLARLLLRFREGGVHLLLRPAVAAVDGDEFLRFRALAREFFEHLHVGERLGAGQQFAQLVVTRRDGVEFCKHIKNRS